MDLQARLDRLESYVNTLATALNASLRGSDADVLRQASMQVDRVAHATAPQMIPANIAEVAPIEQRPVSPVRVEPRPVSPIRVEQSAPNTGAVRKAAGRGGFTGRVGRRDPDTPSRAHRIRVNLTREAMNEVRENNLPYIMSQLARTRVAGRIMPNLWDSLLLEQAATFGHTNMVKLFLNDSNMKYRVRPNDLDSRALKSAVEGGHIDVVRALLDDKVLQHRVDPAVGLPIAREKGLQEIEALLLNAMAGDNGVAEQQDFSVGQQQTDAIRRCAPAVHQKVARLYYDYQQEQLGDMYSQNIENDIFEVIVEAAGDMLIFKRLAVLNCAVFDNQIYSYLRDGEPEVLEAWSKHEFNEDAHQIDITTPTSVQCPGLNGKNQQFAIEYSEGKVQNVRQVA